MTAVATSNTIEQQLVGEAADDYHLKAFRANGQFGLVFEAEHSTSGQIAAVKVLHPSRLQAEHLNDFDQEGQILTKLVGCDGAVPIFSRGNLLYPPSKSGYPFDLPLPFQVLALADGSLADFCSSPDALRQLTLIRKLQLWRSATLSLMRIHARGVAHRDVKADNCLVFTEPSGKIVVRYGDFGRAKDLSKVRTRPEDQYVFGRGDPMHAPPEALLFQAGSEPDDFKAADYYGLGSILVELLTGFSMTRLEVNDIGGTRRQAAYDVNKGQTRDLSVLKFRHGLIVEEIVKLVPKSIQSDIRTLLITLCHPVASDRLVRGPYGRDRNDREPMNWVLRRIDIMSNRLLIDERLARRARERSN